MNRPTIILLANYRPDGQYSMLSCSDWMERLLRERGWSVSTVRPRTVFGSLTSSTVSGIGKWFGYLDKYVLFPIELLGRLLLTPRNCVWHIVDQSNSVYLFLLAGRRHVITVHDIIAIRAARGDFPNHVQVGASGKLLQAAIWRGLQRARFVACDSEASRRDLLELLQRDNLPCKATVRVTLNSSYREMTRYSREQARPILAESTHPTANRIADNELPFILHVGGDVWYKNRPAVPRIFAEWLRQFSHREESLVMVGRPIAPSDLPADFPTDRIHFVGGLSDAELDSLYVFASALLFPSLIEGFGLPVLEAQFFGCPVVAGDRPSTNEIAGDAATLFDPEDDQAGVAALEATLAENDAARAERNARAQANLARFQPEPVFASYRELYEAAARS